jgi:hypothetical protein
MTVHKEMLPGRDDIAETPERQSLLARSISLYSIALGSSEGNVVKPRGVRGEGIFIVRPGVIKSSDLSTDLLLQQPSACSFIIHFSYSFNI